MRLLWAVALTAAAGCAPVKVAPTPAPVPTRAEAAAQQLPEGAGKRILEASCTSCHDLGEVTKLRGFYTRAQWRDTIVTMVEYGAAMEKTDVDVLADYLAQHLGK